jgi:hypothetical protein
LERKELFAEVIGVQDEEKGSRMGVKKTMYLPFMPSGFGRIGENGCRLFRRDR